MQAAQAGPSDPRELLAQALKPALLASAQLQLQAQQQQLGLGLGLVQRRQPEAQRGLDRSWSEFSGISRVTGGAEAGAPGARLSGAGSAATTVVKLSPYLQKLPRSSPWAPVGPAGGRFVLRGMAARGACSRIGLLPLMPLPRHVRYTSPPFPPGKHTVCDWCACMHMPSCLFQVAKLAAGNTS